MVGRKELPLARNPEGKPCMLVVNGAACGREECRRTVRSDS
jgi:hypothetical protein